MLPLWLSSAAPIGSLNRVDQLEGPRLFHVRKSQFERKFKSVHVVLTAMLDVKDVTIQFVNAG